MFFNCNKFNQDLSKWYMPYNTTIKSTFLYCNSIENKNKFT